MAGSSDRSRFIEQVIEAQEQERARLARELHDGVGQTLTSLLVGLRTLESAVGQDDGARQMVVRLREAALGAIDEVRALAHGLRPTALDDLGLGPAVQRMVEEVGTRHGFDIDVQMTGIDRSSRLPAMLEITVYRIVQEALNNIAKHADARRASVILERHASQVRVIVEDDGRGMKQSPPGRGFGLQGIRERIAPFHGELVIESSTSGTALFVTLPVEDAAPCRAWISLQGNEVPLPPGTYLVGRSNACEIQLDSPRVSRRHARLIVGEYRVQLEDLESTNRVYVNGRPVDGVVTLQDGDEIVIGAEVVGLRTAPRAAGVDSGRLWAAEKTLPGRSLDKAAAREVTDKADVLDLIGPVARRLLEAGQPRDAEHLLQGHLRQVLAALQAGRSLPDSVVDSAISYAAALAQDMASGAWLDAAMEMCRRSRRPVPAGLVATAGRLQAAAAHGGSEPATSSAVSELSTQRKPGDAKRR